MPRELISPRTAAANSATFVVNPAEGPRGISATGLAGSETVTVSRNNGAGTFVPLTDTSAILTATSPASSIIASGEYRLEKTSSAGAVGAYID